MKKTIAAIALSASSTSAFALIAPQNPIQTKTYCVSLYDFDDGAKTAGSCDETKNNVTLGKEILSNGCAEEQVALIAVKTGRGRAAKFNIEIGSCLPPNVVQL